MAKIIYMQDTLTLIANTEKFGLARIKEITEASEMKQTKNGYHYFVIENKTDEIK